MKNLKIKFIILLASLFSAENFYGQNTCVSNCGTITGGSNKTILCPGNCIQIGSGPSCGSTCGSTTYTWTPATGLSNQYICTPTACPTITTTYTLTAVFDGTCCCDGGNGNCAIGNCPSVQRTATVKVTVTSTGCRLINPEQEKEQTNAEINLFPNPSEGKFALQFNKINAGTCVIFFDANGKMVKADQNISVDNKQITYDLSAQAKGIYYIKIVESENTIYFKKLILQ